MMEGILKDFVPAKISEAYGKKINVATVYAFVESGEKCMVCKSADGKLYEGLRKAVLRHELPVDVIKGNDGVYLVRNNLRKFEKGIKERTCQMVPDPDFDILECSECGYEEEKLYVVPTKGPIEFDGNFCPNCGARVERDA